MFTELYFILQFTLQSEGGDRYPSIVYYVAEVTKSPKRRREPHVWNLRAWCGETNPSNIMSRRQKAVSEDPSGPGGKDVVPETRTTRSGRKVRTPALLLEQEAPARTPARRTRRSALQELPVEVEKNNAATEPIPEEILREPSEAESRVGADPVELPAEAGEVSLRTQDDGHMANAAPTNADSVPSKKRRLDSGKKQNPVIPLGKPKSGRVWKNRNKQR